MGPHILKMLFNGMASRERELKGIFFSQAFLDPIALAFFSLLALL